jgi:hypothetical protein
VQFYLSIFYLFNGMTGSRRAGIYIAETFLASTFFMHKNIESLKSLFHPRGIIRWMKQAALATF